MSSSVVKEAGFKSLFCWLMTVYKFSPLDMKEKVHTKFTTAAFKVDNSRAIRAFFPIKEYDKPFTHNQPSFNPYILSFVANEHVSIVVDILLDVVSYNTSNHRKRGKNV